MLLVDAGAGPTTYPEMVQKGPRVDSVKLLQYLERHFGIPTMMEIRFGCELQGGSQEKPGAHHDHTSLRHAVSGHLPTCFVLQPFDLQKEFVASGLSHLLGSPQLAGGL